MNKNNTNNIYNEQILLKMLDETIGYMVENACCNDCIYSGTTDCRTNLLNNLCSDGIFEGLYRKFKKQIKKVS